MGTDQAGRELVAAAWPDPRAADRVVGDLVGVGAPVRIDTLNAAALVLGHDGRLRIHGNDADPGGITISGVLGAALGVLAGGPGWLILGGGILEHLAAAARDVGLAQRPLRDFGDTLRPGWSAVLAVVPPGSAEVLRRDLTLLAGTVTVQHVDAAVVQRTGLSPAIRYHAGDVGGDVIAARPGTPGQYPRPPFSHSTGEPRPAERSYRSDRD